MLRRFWIVLALMLAMAPYVRAADEKEAAKEPAAKAGADAVADFEKQFAEWKDLLAQLRALRAKWLSVKPDERKEIEDEYAGLVKRGEEMEPKIIAGAQAAYDADPAKDPEIGKFLAELANEEVERDDYEPALKQAELLIKHNYDNPRVYNLAGVSAFCTNQFDKAKEYLNKAQKASALDSTGQTFLSKIDECQKLWEKEAELRAAEAKADDLPRVLLKTSKGDIEIELFENEAPNTVANFISLVEKGFYDGLNFHRVLPHFMAQGGDPKGNGTGGPGYNIECECYKPERRLHFRGSLSMAHAGRDSGGSQFFMMFRPSGPTSGYDLNGKHTVFGRIIKGMDVLADIQRTEGAEGMPTNKEPDKIVEAKVLRKRDHEYKPRHVGEPEASAAKPAEKKPAAKQEKAEKKEEAKQEEPAKKEPAKDESKQDDSGVKEASKDKGDGDKDEGKDDKADE
ncbi:MAG TPA: peptidylprolyl isomerase [Pirellulales bacterium]|nr:peptidylprolyl isomerase [Pirellulales bacterium]